jgi:hypothetical protein
MFSKTQVAHLHFKKLGLGEHQLPLKLIKPKITHSHKQYITCEISVNSVVIMKM